MRRNFPKGRENVHQRAAAYSIPAALFFLLLLIGFPLLLVLARSVWKGGRLDLAGLLPELGAANFAVVFANTFALGLAVSLLSLLLSLPLAFLMAKTELGRHRFLEVLLLVPFMTPPYISAMSWVQFMQKKGFLEQMIPAAAAVTPGFFSLFGLVVIMSLQVFPVAYLLLKDTLAGIGDHLDEAAAVHGGNFFYRFRRVFLPLLLPGCSVGALLVFTKAISEFGAPATFGRTIGYHVMITEIYQYVSNWPIDMGSASAISLWLMAACLLFLFLQSRVSARFTHRLVGGREAYTARYRLAGWKRALGWGYIAVLLLLSVGIPYFSIVASSLLKVYGLGLSPGNFTSGHYLAVLSPSSPGLSALLNSLSVSALAATAADVLGILLGLLLVYGPKGRLLSLVHGISVLPNTVPGIVLILGLIFFWNDPRNPLHIYNTYPMVVVAYVALFLPYAVEYVQTGISQISPSLWQMGTVFSGRRIYLLCRIIVPLIVSHLLSAWALTFVFAMRELVASLMILPPGMQNAASYIYAQFDQGDVSDGMALAVVSVLLTSAVFALVMRLGRPKTHI